MESHHDREVNANEEQNLMMIKNQWSAKNTEYLWLFVPIQESEKRLLLIMIDKIANEYVNNKWVTICPEVFS